MILTKRQLSSSGDQGFRWPRSHGHQVTEGPPGCSPGDEEVRVLASNGELNGTQLDSTVHIDSKKPVDDFLDTGWTDWTSSDGCRDQIQLHSFLEAVELLGSLCSGF